MRVLHSTLARKLMTSTQADIEYKLSPCQGTFTKVTTASLGRTTVYDMPTEGEFCPAKTLSGRLLLYSRSEKLCHKDTAQCSQSPL